MKFLSVLMRDDLNMRTGKMASQSGHSGMKAALSAMSLQSGRITIDHASYDELRDFVANPLAGVAMATGEMLAKTPNTHLVYDNGHTEFNGVRTLTCSSAGLYGHYQGDVVSNPTGVSERKLRQYLIFAKRDKKPSKRSVCAAAAVGCIQRLYIDLKIDACWRDEGVLVTPPVDNDILEWLETGYGKIALYVDGDAAFDCLRDILVNFAIEHTETEFDGERVLVLRPYAQERVAGHLGALPML
ncbi:peptidyl-tRNA hydrolase [Pseudomonas aeruginosa]